MRLLIVSDDDEVRGALTGVLRDNGYPPPLLASTGREALAALLRDEPADGALPADVLLVDADLQGDSDLELCRQLREMPCMKDLPVLVLTGLPGAQAYEKTCAAGACDFVRKPLQPDELLGRLHAACVLKHQLDDCREHTRELERANQEIQRLAVLDELTGIANRRFFNRIITQEWARAVREVVPLSLIMADIDFFKDFNDRYGHLCGDECLRRVAGALQAIAKRPGDHVARYGGEEFMVILSHTGIQGAMAVAEALRARVEDLNLEHAAPAAHGRVTISLGVASTVPERSGSPDQLIAAADQAAYEAKRAGRNRVRAFHGPYLHTHPSYQQPHESAAQRVE